MSIETQAYNQAVEIWGESSLLQKTEKLIEEVHELFEACLNEDEKSIDDEIGDSAYILAFLAHKRGMTINGFINNAMQKNEIRKTNPNYKR